jgi:hypothetical protein
MSGSGKSGDDASKREILQPGDSLLETSSNAGDRAEAHARAARRILDDQAHEQREAEEARLGWHGRLWRRLRKFLGGIGSFWRPFGDFFARRLPRTARVIANAFGVLTHVWLAFVWPAIDRISHRTDAKGERRLSIVGKILAGLIVAVAIWPLFKIYYVLATKRHFHDVDITFKQIISHDRYLVFGDYKDDDGATENMAFNVTDSWVYWNWTPDLTFAQIPLVGKCNFTTYGWYVRVPKFIPLFGRTLLVEPVVIEAHCKSMTGRPTGPVN